MKRLLLARNAMYTLLCAGLVAIAGCNQPAAPTQPPAVAASTPAPAQTNASEQQPAYTPPTADQLYQLVAPIALFPDKLVAQVLAGATYPDQITAADNQIDQNPKLKGVPLQTAIAQQPWDPSVKGLTIFPTVLDQMAKNIDWTTALGEAYVNDPTDVMNAIQVMRGRASTHGNLRSSGQLRVNTQTVTTQTSSYASDPNNPVYSGPSVIAAPRQIIEIQPTQPDTVYVPQYNPQVVYGEQVAYYPGYSYESPRVYGGGEVLAVGAIGFGAGILVGALFDHHYGGGGYGWNSWGVNWGGGGGGYGGDYGGRYGGNDGGGNQRPAVVYNNKTYVSRSNTVINHNVYEHNNYSRTSINNSHNDTTNNDIHNNNHNDTLNNDTHNNNSHNQVVQNRDVGNSTINNHNPVSQNHDVGNSTVYNHNPVMQNHDVRSATVNNHTTNAPLPSAAAARAPMTIPHFDGKPQRGVTMSQDKRTLAPAASNVARANAFNQRPLVAPDHATRQNVNRTAAAPSAPARAAAVQRFTQPQHINNEMAQGRQGPPSQPPRQAQQRPEPAPRQQQQRAAPRQAQAAAAVQRFTQPQHINNEMAQGRQGPPSQPPRQAQQRPAPRQQQRAAPRQAPAPRPQAVAHQQQALRPHPQQQHQGGDRPAPSHREHERR